MVDGAGWVDSAYEAAGDAAGTAGGDGAAPASAAGQCLCCSGRGECTGGGCLCENSRKERGCRSTRMPLEVVRGLGAVEFDGSSSSSLVDTCWVPFDSAVALGDREGCSISPGIVGWDTSVDRRVLLSASNDAFAWRVLVAPESLMNVSVLFRYGTPPVLPHTAAMLEARGEMNASDGYDFSMLVRPGGDTTYQLDAAQLAEQGSGFLYITMVGVGVPSQCGTAMMMAQDGSSPSTMGCASYFMYSMNVEDSTGSAVDGALLALFIIGIAAAVALCCHRGIRARAAKAAAAAAGAVDTSGKAGAAKTTSKQAEEEKADIAGFREEAEAEDPSIAEGKEELKKEVTAAAAGGIGGVGPAWEAGAAADAVEPEFNGSFDRAVAIAASVVDLLGRSVTAMFGVAVVWASLDGVGDIAGWSAVADAIESVFGPVGALLRVFSGLLGTVDLVPALADDWNCGGALGLLSLLALVAALAVAHLTLRRDWLLVATFMLRGGRCSNRAARRLARSASASAGNTLLYVLQALLASASHLVTVLLSRKATCSDFDDTVLTFAFIVFTSLVMFVAAPVLLYAFAGRVDWKYGPFGVLFQAVRNLLALTVGVWGASQEYAFEVAAKASRVSRQPESAETHEAVIELTAKSRGALWMVVPGCGILAKAAEVLNKPPGYVASKGVLMRKSPRKRLVEWGFNIVTVVAILLSVLSGTAGAAVLLLVSLLPAWILEVLEICGLAATRVSEEVSQVNPSAAVSASPPATA